MVKIKSYGKYAPTDEMIPTVKASDFDGYHLKGLSVNTHRRDKFAVLFAETEVALLPYSVIFGFSRIVFGSLKDAELFCETHGFTKIKEELR